MSRKPHASSLEMWLAIALILSLASAKLVSGKARLDGVNTEHEMTKFAYWYGKGRVVAEFWVASGEKYDVGSLAMYAYTGEHKWRKASRMPTCEEKIALADWRQRIGSLNGDSAQSDSESGSRSSPVVSRRSIHASQKQTRVWYFALADCSLERFYHTVPEVEYTIETTGPMNRQLPIDEHGMGKLHFWNCAVSGGGALAFAAWHARRGGPHAAVAALVLAAVADSLASWFELLHISAFERDGIGSYACDALSAQFEALCDATISLLLLAIGAGWTLRASLSDDEKAGRSPLRDETVAEQAASAVAPLASALRYPLALPWWFVASYFGMHVGIAQWSRAYSDDFDSFHDHEHLAGRVLVLSRLLIAALFVPILLRTQACAGLRLRRFLVGWAAIGTTWFLALPLLCLLAAKAPAHSRHRFVSGGAALSTTAALGALALLFSGKLAPYYLAISTVGGGDANLDLGPPAAVSPNNSGSIASQIAAAQAKLPSAIKLGKLKVRLD